MKLAAVMTLLMLVCIGGAGAQEPRPTVEGATQLLALHDSTGWFDDAFALDAKGEKLVVVRQDATRADQEARVIDLAHPDAPPLIFPLAAVGPPLAEIDVLAKGSQVLAIGGDPDAPVSTVLAPGGKVVRKLGPATAFARSRAGGDEVLTLLERKPGTVTITMVKLDTGETIARRTLAIDGPGRIASLGLTFCCWSAGFTQLIGSKEGVYDKKADRRLPTSEVTFDLLTNKVIADVVPIGDLVEHANVLSLRQAHLGGDRFVTWTQDAQSLEAITTDNRRLRLTLAAPIADYDPQTLQQEPFGDGKLAFSLGDGKVLDLYVVDLGAPTIQATRVARIPTTGHPVKWHLAGSRLAVLFQHKTFQRGGTDVVVYDLGK